MRKPKAIKESQPVDKQQADDGYVCEECGDVYPKELLDKSDPPCKYNMARCPSCRAF
jgi:DNA-directed RNA polymerase subunit RPC12/RpoP